MVINVSPSADPPNGIASPSADPPNGIGGDEGGGGREAVQFHGLVVSRNVHHDDMVAIVINIETEVGPQVDLVRVVDETSLLDMAEEVANLQ